MLSLETAKKLKAAGLHWEPRVGDFYWAEKCDHTDGRLCICQMDGAGFYQNIIVTWIPRLDQLLTEIKTRGWEYALYSDNTIEIETDKENIPVHLRFKTFIADDLDESVAQALLWILKQNYRS